jgi:hypothetical protein
VLERTVAAVLWYDAGMSTVSANTAGSWPELPLDAWEPTYLTLHRWTQVIGKIRLALCAPVNHWWHTSLRFNARGLTTTLMPYENRQFEMAFDFVDHMLRISTTDGRERVLPLVPRSVAAFYDAVLRELEALDISVRIWPVPVEVPNPVPFARDLEHASYDREAVERMWKILIHVYADLSRFRGKFVGKSSPVHFFWGACPSCGKRTRTR